MSKKQPNQHDDDDYLDIFDDDDDDDYDNNSGDENDFGEKDDDDDDQELSCEEDVATNVEDEKIVIKKSGFLFNEEIIFQKLPDSELTNNYQAPWKSLDSYIKTMTNLTIENYIFNLRKNLNELRDNQLDPRDLYLYQNVQICPIYDYYVKKKSKSITTQYTRTLFRSNEHDLFIHFEVRSPTYFDGKRSIVKEIKKINWEHTDRLQKRSLLFFSLSPYMETIDAVGYSCAKKGTIDDNIVPIKLLQGELDFLEQYFMFEPINQWNEAIVDNLINTNENTIPQCLINPFIFLNFSDNKIENGHNFVNRSIRKKMIVDNEQYKALEYSLNHHLTLVNGAPGTGKTHLGCEVVKYLIQSKFDSPILVVTYKNVSLDNFLDKISGFLQENDVDFIRIGGKPRTKNNFILQNDYKQSFPNRKLKHELLYVISLLILMEQDCISDLDFNKFGPNLKRFIDEIEKIVSLRKKLFDKFPFFSDQEQTLITNFFIQNQQVLPPPYVYFVCYMNEPSYFDEQKEIYNQNLKNECISLLGQLNSYNISLINGEIIELNPLINDIITKHFSSNKERFHQFLSSNKTRIKFKDTSVLYDIIQISSNPAKNIRLKDCLIENEIQFWDKNIIKQVSEEFDSMFSSQFDIEMFNELFENISPLFRRRKIQLENLIEKRASAYQDTKTKELGEILSTKKLIAMTATRAAQFKKSLDLSNCKFMIFEEAGELTEPITISIIPKTVQQLMMIGDYNQLRPTVEYNLTKKPFFFDISLFEKVVIQSKKRKNNNLFTLSIQRRMHPQIASMIRRAFYDDNQKQEKLVDDDCVKSLGKPIGFPTHLQFFLHDFKEESETQIRRSHSNVEEAKFCAYLFLMMLCRGYKSTEITIISLYKGQKKQIEQEICSLMDQYYSDQNLEFYDAFDFEKDIDESNFSEEQLEKLKSIDKRNNFNKIIEFRKKIVKRFVKCLDDFQGEENEVIIISLTRSEKPGFLSSRNRSLVTLSRAKQMEFVIGNKNVFGPSNLISPLWSSISSQFTDEYTLSYKGISACSCPVHVQQQKVFSLNNIDHLLECRFNCCHKKCDNFNKCKHQCEMPCHLHIEIKKDFPNLFELFERRYYCPKECIIRCKNNHELRDICGSCTHFGIPKCPKKCESKCALCSRKCVLNCSHKGRCQCGHLDNFLNLVKAKYICDECIKKNETIRKNRNKK